MPFRAATFDCYGTLIDWQSGLDRAARDLFAGLVPPLQGPELYRRFASAERDVEAGPYRSYREVLREVARRLTDGGASAAAQAAFAASVPDWPAFPETPAALARIKRAVGRLAVVSNVDADLFDAPDGSLDRLGVPLDALVAASEVRSYKPGRAHFDRVLRALDLPAADVLHVAESRFHDIAPAGQLGFTTVWIDRVRSGPSASGPGDGRPDYTFPSLTALADALESGRVTPRGPHPAPDYR